MRFLLQNRIIFVGKPINDMVSSARARLCAAVRVAVCGGAGAGARFRKCRICV
jgi:hypothetical protein